MKRQNNAEYSDYGFENFGFAHETPQGGRGQREGGGPPQRQESFEDFGNFEAGPPRLGRQGG